MDCLELGGVALLVAEPPQWNSTTRQDPSNRKSLLYLLKQCYYISILLYLYAVFHYLLRKKRRNKYIYLEHKNCLRTNIFSFFLLLSL